MRALGAEQADAVVVVGRDDGVCDRPHAGLGPLGGIAGALAYGAAHGYASVLTLPCDMPLLPEPLLPALLRRAPSFCLDAPVIGHWPSALAPSLLRHIAESPRRSVQNWARSIGALPIPSPAPLVNVNTPDDLLAL
ncbi:hypothetical protein BW41_03702 [Sphingomonas sp. RIT328]|nr:hypothetical protein BW41_03702 [Sphingomonas sp. RIT328]